MTTYQLIYFNTEGRAEVIRYIFALAGVKYEDKRVELGEEWAELKPKTPYAQLPVLKVDGKFLSGTGPIVRYLAEKYDLAGSDDFENAEIAGITDIVEDFVLKMIPLRFEKDETRKAALQKEIVEVHFPRYLDIFEKLISENGKEQGWCYRSKLTYADVSIYRCTDFPTLFNPKALDDYPGIQKLRASISAIPNFAKWLKERPQQEKP